MARKGWTAVCRLQDTVTVYESETHLQVKCRCKYPAYETKEEITEKHRAMWNEKWAFLGRSWT